MSGSSTSASASRATQDRELFDRIAERYARKDLGLASKRARRRRLLSSLSCIPYPDQARILELGCGAGFTVQYLGRKTYSRYVGVDYSAELIALARRQHGKFGDQVEFLMSDVHELALAERFDVALMIGVLHHDGNPADLVQTAVNHLEPGGWLIANEPQPANPAIRLARRLRKKTDRSYSDQQVEIAGSELRQLFDRAGLEEVRLRAQGLLSTPLAEVLLPAQALLVPVAITASAIDATLEGLMNPLLRLLSWNLVAAGRKPHR